MLRSCCTGNGIYRIAVLGSGFKQEPRPSAMQNRSLSFYYEPLSRTLSFRCPSAPKNQPWLWLTCCTPGYLVGNCDAAPDAWSQEDVSECYRANAIALAESRSQTLVKMPSAVRFRCWVVIEKLTVSVRPRCIIDKSLQGLPVSNEVNREHTSAHFY